MSLVQSLDVSASGFKFENKMGSRYVLQLTYANPYLSKKEMKTYKVPYREIIEAWSTRDNILLQVTINAFAQQFMGWDFGVEHKSIRVTHEMISFIEIALNPVTHELCDTPGLPSTSDILNRLYSDREKAEVQEFLNISKFLIKLEADFAYTSED